ncbi:MAG: Dabb family protein [Alphaproteobacteria bacterium]|nr:Dabb family protein [Alphaproteobacteria bacterium]
MIRHIVFFSLKDRSQTDVVVADLSRLGDIPGSTTFEVRINQKADQIGNEIDIVVYGEFPSLAALRAYKQHPIYEATTRAVRPLRELRFAADIET